MFGSGFRVDEQNPGCTGCSFVADHFDGVIPHLNGHDVTLVSESIAPLETLNAYAARMGWKFPWVSSLGGDFRYDSGRRSPRSSRETADQLRARRSGVAAARGNERVRPAAGVVHHTYSSYARGVEQLMGTFGYLDVAPFGATRMPRTRRHGGAATMSTKKRDSDRVRIWHPAAAASSGRDRRGVREWANRLRASA